MLRKGLLILLTKHTPFENFSKQVLWELHEIEKKITPKANVLSKTRSFRKMLFENLVPTCVLHVRHSLNMSLARAYAREG